MTVVPLLAFSILFTVGSECFQRIAVSDSTGSFVVVVVADVVNN